MLTTTPMTVFKDCTVQDMIRYFQNTCLLWNLSRTKRRIFIPETFASDAVVGNYLTREKEWKSKTFKTDDWLNSVEIISLEPRVFNLKTAAAVWSPHLQQNFKKSFIYNVASVKFFGKPAPEETYTQELVHRAFGELYGYSELPTLDQALSGVGQRVYTFTREGFAIDWAKGTLLFHNIPVATIPNSGGIKVTSPQKFMNKLIRQSTRCTVEAA